jgi:uncharacterized repeat protein (TIGR01451 family)
MTVAFAPAASASPSGSLDQCANGPSFPIPSTQCSAIDASSWINGDLNSNKSSYREGDTVPFRASMGGFTALSTGHTVVITYQSTKSGKHAYDYLTSYNRTVLGADPCAGSATCLAPATPFPIPADPHVTGLGVTPLPGGVFSCFECLVTAVSSYSLSGLYSGDSQTSVTVTFTALASSVVLAWGGHVASPLDWGPGSGAASIPGSPYHMMLTSVDSGSVGAQDRAMAASNLAPAPTIVTTASPSLVTVNHTVTDGATLTGTATNGKPSGTVTFFVCGPAGTAPDCSAISSGSQVGSPVTVTTSGTDSGSATSPAFTPTASGWYCFRAEYAPDSNANYSPATETNQNTECFFAQDVGLNITKSADASPVNAGSAIGYTISVTNSGSTDATSVTVTDVLPTNSGTSWSVSAVDLAGVAQSSSWIATNCAIATGTLTCHMGTVPAHTSSGYTIHLSSPTTAATCGTVSNSANATAANNISATTPAPAVVDVDCPGLAITKTPDHSSVSAGDTIGYTISVTNSGAGSASNAVVTDSLPTNSGTSWSVDAVDLAGVAQSSAWIAANCSPSGSTLTCHMGTVPGGTTSGYTIHLSSPTTAATCGTVSNSATVSPSIGASASTAAPAVITVNCPNLGITKTPDNASVPAGSTIGYTISVTNSGQGNSYDTTVSDHVPTTSGTSWSVDAVDLAGVAQSGSWITANCTAAAGTISCDLGTVPGGTTSGYSVHLTSPTTPASCGTVSNSAKVTPANGAAVSTTAPAVVTVTCAPVLSATKSSNPVSGSSVSPGQTVTYDLTLDNAGTAPASAVVVTDAVPAGTTYVPASASCGVVPTCVVTVVNGVITWTGVDVPPASGQTPGSVVLSFEATVDNTVTNGQVIPNTASFTNNHTASCTTSTCPTNTVTLNAVVPASSSSTPPPPPPPPPVAAASSPAPKPLPIVAATEVHTGKPWAGARPYEIIVVAFGILLMAFGFLRRRHYRMEPAATVQGRD